MQKNDKEKEFDCLAFKDQVQTEIYEETKRLSREEMKQFFHQRATQGSLSDFWAKIPARNPKVRRVA